MKISIKKKEWLIIGGILLFAGIMWMVLFFYRRGSCGQIRITVDGQEYGIYSLDKDQSIPIGDTNICEIRDGQVTMTHADCPDHLCMEQAPVGENGGTIVCLPNKVVIEGITGKKQTQDGLKPDAVT